ncbi:TPA: phage tail protein [Klebsiella pneumoniae]
MSQTVITSAFEQLKAQEAANGGVVILDEFVFANIPNLDITSPIDRGEGLPEEAMIVHRQAVGKTGMVNNNAVVYSVVMGADVGDFEFNWVGLVNKANNIVAMIVHAPTQKKIKTATGQQGNVLTRSFLMEYNGASEQTQIITPADTWQIDFTARLNGVDERIRLENMDIYGPAAFLGDGFLVVKTADKYSVKKGTAYIAGVRGELLFDQNITVGQLPAKVWVDVSWKGTLTSVWASAVKLTVAETLENYTENDEQHYVYAVAEIEADGSVVDLRPASFTELISRLGDKDSDVIIGGIPAREIAHVEPARPPAVVGRSVGDLILDGVAGLRKNFAAIGDGDHDDTQAFNDWWNCLMDVMWKRRQAEPGELPFFLKKGALLNIEHGVFVYDGPGLNITENDSFVLNVAGESKLSTKILIAGDSYLFDCDNNPVTTLLKNMTIHGGLGALRYKSKERATGGMHSFIDLQLSMYRECGISNNSIDMPYVGIERCAFFGDPAQQTIGACISGLSAGGYITGSIFSDNRYGVKLAVSDNGTERNGPATPFNIYRNDFYRTGRRGDKASYDVWMEPGATANNAGRGVVFSLNKFGQEYLISPDAHILIADAFQTGTGAGLNGDRHHKETVSEGYISGVRMDGNNVNSANKGYVSPYIRSFTPKVGNMSVSDIFDNDMPSRIIEFAGGITQSQIGNLSRSNVFDASQCMALEKGVIPRLLSNMNDVFRIKDPLGYFCGHPQNSNPVVLSDQRHDFVHLFAGPTSGVAVYEATRASLSNSYGGVNEATEITMSSEDGRAVLSVSGCVAGKLHWIDLDVRRGSVNSVETVSAEILDSEGKILHVRRLILLNSQSVWQRVIIPYVPNNSGTFNIKIKGVIYAVGNDRFQIGNMNVYMNDAPVNTGHNSGLSMSWSMQHVVKGGRHEWYDATGNLRAKKGVPTSDTDGVVISANPVI